MQKQTNRLRGLSLIELVIVVAMIGILAAIVIPRFSNATDASKASAVTAQISTVKKALIVYKNEHNDAYPTADQLINNPWQALTNSTDINGDAAGDTYGPYLLKAPINIYQNTSTIASDDSAAWQYDPDTGTIKAVVPQAIIDNADELNIAASDFVSQP